MYAVLTGEVLGGVTQPKLVWYVRMVLSPFNAVSLINCHFLHSVSSYKYIINE